MPAVARLRESAQAAHQVEEYSRLIYANQKFGSPSSIGLDQYNNLIELTPGRSKPTASLEQMLARTRVDAASLRSILSRTEREAVQEHDLPLPMLIGQVEQSVSEVANSTAIESGPDADDTIVQAS